MTGSIGRIWVDADACPRAVREILYRAAERTKVVVTLVANRPLALPPRIPTLRMLLVGSGFDVADAAIGERVAAGDFVVTSDIALAADVLAKGAHAVSPRGERFSSETIRGQLTMRDFMDTMRASGVSTRGPAPLDAAGRNAFASHLDRWLAQQRYQGSEAPS